MRTWLHLIFSALVILFPLNLMAATQFDELDKPPEGAHEGQMLLGAFVAVGIPFGSCIDAENAFLKGSSYTFPNDTTKQVEVSHLSFGFGLSFEYMPIDYVGAKAKLRQSSIIQRSNFGPDYENFRGTLYKDIALYVGPAFHTTVRKRWDFTLSPVIGYAYGIYRAAPVGSKILENTTGDRVTGETKRTVTGLTYGAELNCTIYFSGGLFMSFGGEWIRNNLNFGKAFDVTNPQTGNKYFNDGSSGIIDSVCLIVTAGYAFSN